MSLGQTRINVSQIHNRWTTGCSPGGQKFASVRDLTCKVFDLSPIPKVSPPLSPPFFPHPPFSCRHHFLAAGPYLRILPSLRSKRTTPTPNLCSRLYSSLPSKAHTTLTHYSILPPLPPSSRPFPQPLPFALPLCLFVPPPLTLYVPSPCAHNLKRSPISLFPLSAASFPVSFPTLFPNPLSLCLNSLALVPPHCFC